MLPFNRKRKMLDKKWAEYIETAKECEKDGKWEGIVIVTSEAGNAYFELAKLFEFEPSEQHIVSTYYLESAHCYNFVFSERAYETYLLAIEADLKRGAKKGAIEISVRCGYQYEKDWGDFGKSDEFYDKADELRVKYNLKHICAITSEYLKGVIRDVSKKLDGYSQNPVNLIHSKSKIMYEAGVCRKCIHFWKIFDEYFDEIRKEENRNKIKWLKKYHEKFKEKLAQTIADVERLAEERKNGAPGKDPSQQYEDA
ncbi:hypothetical protein RF11_05632 [Thelohanellus kitauei]|uniref:Uncharacterized protein n=1 Tax=Thelohanellus kitauei TaxID=669202 RepID=A0A0C2J0D1_THEKT|nr:hypothetical protein RF11_05632 [Thelohanellus kitauei]